MAPRVVHVHIGSPKTGTTYIQDVLWDNRKALDADGVLLPGHYRYARVQAIRDLIKWDPEETPRPPKTWTRIAKEINRWSGRSAIFSMEFLCWASQEQAQHLVDSLAGSQVKVVLTTRDLARLVPAQWQTAMRQRNTWTLSEYAAGAAATSDPDQVTGAGRHFWQRQDYGAILRHWARFVGVENLTVVTLPPSGADPGELWHRFCAATDLEGTGFELAEARHESLGAASAEVMRRLNGTGAVQDMARRDYQKTVNGALSNRSLAPRRGLEARLVLPPEHADWASREAKRIISEIEAVGPRVIGSLDDLVPRPSTAQPIEPSELPADDLLTAAIDGLAGLSVQYAQLRNKLDDLEAEKSALTRRLTEPQPTSGLESLKDSWRRRRSRR